MVSIVNPSKPNPPGTEPAWEIARLFPNQGVWDEGDYLALDTNHLVELTDGYVEVLPMPKLSHQLIVRFLGDRLREHVEAEKRGLTVLAPFRIRVRKNKFREPDVSFMLSSHADRIGEDYWEGADLVMEVVSDDAESQSRDFTRKRVDYAEARIPEYWIVDPHQRKVFVLTMNDGGEYVEHGAFGSEDEARSALLPGFRVDVSQVFAAASSGL